MQSPLRVSELIVRIPPSELEVSRLSVMQEVRNLPPELPKVTEISDFIKLAQAVVKLPDKQNKSQNSETLSLDDILAEPTILDRNKLLELTVKGLNLLVRIDPRFFTERNEVKAPFEILKQQSDLAVELVKQYKQIKTQVSQCYQSEFEALLKNIMLAIDYHRGDPLMRTVESLDIVCKLVVLEMCYDAGINPVVSIPDAQMAKGATPNKSIKLANHTETKPERAPKKLNYGRPNETAAEQAVTAKDETASDQELRQQILSQSQDELRSALHTAEVSEIRSHLNRARKGGQQHSIFGMLKISQETAAKREDLQALANANRQLPSWLQAQIRVSESNIEKTAPPPYLQTVCEQIVDLAARVINFTEIYKNNAVGKVAITANFQKVYFDTTEIQNWSLSDLNNKIQEVTKLRKAYSYVVEVMEAIAGTVKDQKLSGKLDDNSRLILQRLAPEVIVVADANDGVFESYLSARKGVEQERILNGLAIRILNQGVHPKLKQYADDDPQKFACALELAKAELIKQRPLGE